LYLDPATLQQGGVVTRAQALSHLASVLGPDALTRVLNPKRKRLDERAAEEQVRQKFSEALRRLATLGFVDLLEEDGLKLRAALMRFAEPVRGQGSPAEALEKLVARGEIVLGSGDGEDEPEPRESAAAPPEHHDEPLPASVLSTIDELGDIGTFVEREPPQGEA
jgi:chromosome partition protein MukE